MLIASIDGLMDGWMDGWMDGCVYIDLNECSSNPCTNGGSCFDALNGWRCECAPGFSGERCQTDINECASNVTNQLITPLPSPSPSLHSALLLNLCFAFAFGSMCCFVLCAVWCDVM